MNSRWLKLTVVCLFAITLCCGSGCSKQEPDLEFSLIFKDAKGLQTGQFLEYSGVNIGEVRSVKLVAEHHIEVVIRVYEEHRDKVYREAKFKIHNPIINLSGERKVRMEGGRGERRTPLQPGDVLDRRKGFFESIVEGIKDGGDWLEKRGSELKEHTQQIAESEEVQQFQRTLEDFAEKAEELSEEQWEAFENEHLPRLEAEARQLKQKLEDEGFKEEAEAFWREFMNLDEEAEDGE